MKEANLELPEIDRAKLREVVGTIDREMARLPRQLSDDGHSATTDTMMVSWVELVRLLALGPPPEQRDCPVCQRPGMAAATRCGFCWTSLTPLPPPATTAEPALRAAP